LSYWPRCISYCKYLTNDFCDDARANCSSPFTYCKSDSLIHCNRANQIHIHVDVIARHHHLNIRRQLHRTGDIRSPKIELRTVTFEKRRMSPTLVLR